MLKYMDSKQPMQLINVEGEGGMNRASSAPPDGYHILVHNSLDLVSFTLSGQSGIPLWSELEPICFVVWDYSMIGTNKHTGWKTIEDVAVYAKAHPGEIRWSTIGSQTVDMIDTLIVLEKLGIKEYVTIVPFESCTAAKVALIEDRVQVSISSISNFRSVIASKDCVPLVVLSEKISTIMPNVPTAVEENIKEMQSLSFSTLLGFFAPKGTSPAHIEYLTGILKLTLENPTFKAAMENLGFQVEFVDRETGRRAMTKMSVDMKPLF
jgi:tripartite-type tricarboxylate transporter receptor subunit TctC